MSEVIEEVVKKNKKVSFSQYTLYSACPHQYKLRYIDKLGESSGNINTIFGSAMHETIQNFLTVMYSVSKVEADKINLDSYLFERLKENFVKEKQLLSEGSPCTQIEMEEFYGDGRRILNWFKKNIGKFYSKSGYELVAVEMPLNKEIKPGVQFIGFIDIVLHDITENTIIIIDLKTSTMGWNQYQKADKYKNAQLLLYKKFYSDLYGIPLGKIKVEFQIMRRKLPEESAFPIPYMSKHVPANGAPSVNRNYDEFIEFINTVFDDNGEFRDIKYPKVPGQYKKNCKWCEFKTRGICDGKETK
jgi:GTP-sensing pleiotropic transcriptional regulator CodY